LNCPHCYRDTNRVSNISLEDIDRIFQSVDITAVGMGTGENVLNPHFIEIVRYLSARDVKLSVASNGFTLTTISEDILRAFHDVEVSIDFPTQEEQDLFRGPGNWELVHRAVERCQQIGVEVSILATLMSSNYMEMDRMVSLARLNGVNLRVNAYQAVKTDAYRLDYEQFWEGYRRLFSAGLVVSCSEPVVRAAMGLDEVQSPCGRRSIRVNPLGQVIPCVYWPSGPHRHPTIAELELLGDEFLNQPSFTAAGVLPDAAADCPCQGGCASRRALNGKLDVHDEYCPWVRADEIDLPWQPAPAKDLMRASNVCTTIVV
jgi:MoaA/NifB/PqqE/SkfB family radical SAM enzyme